VLEHESPTASDAVDVKTTDPNSKPEIVTLIPPLLSTFEPTTPVSTGASKVKSNLALPGTFPTEITTTCVPPAYVDRVHANKVLVDQLEVIQYSFTAREAIALRSTL